VGPDELQLIEASGYREFPPRLPFFFQHMFEEYNREKTSRAKQIWVRVGVSLASGAILTFVLPATLAGVLSYSKNVGSQPSFFLLVLIGIMNLPGVIYCRFASLPPSLPKSDEGLYCWAVGFFLNIPYYAMVIFGVWSLVHVIRNRRRPGT